MLFTVNIMLVEKFGQCDMQFQRITSTVVKTLRKIVHTANIIWSEH